MLMVMVSILVLAFTKPSFLTIGGMAQPYDIVPYGNRAVQYADAVALANGANQLPSRREAAASAATASLTATEGDTPPPSPPRARSRPIMGMMDSYEHGLPTGVNALQLVFSSANASHRGEGLLTSASALQTMCEAENLVLAAEAYDCFCLDAPTPPVCLGEASERMCFPFDLRSAGRSSGRDCSPPFSPTSLFYLEWSVDERPAAARRLRDACAEGLELLREEGVEAVEEGQLLLTSLIENMTLAVSEAYRSGLPVSRLRTALNSSRELTEAIASASTIVHHAQAALSGRALDAIMNASIAFAWGVDLNAVHAAVGLVRALALRLTGPESLLHGCCLVTTLSTLLRFERITPGAPAGSEDASTGQSFTVESARISLRSRATSLSVLHAEAAARLQASLAAATSAMSPLLDRDLFDEATWWGVAVGDVVPHPAAPRRAADGSGNQSGVAAGHARDCVRLDSDYVAHRAAQLGALLRRSASLRARYGAIFPSSMLLERSTPTSQHVHLTRSFLMYGVPYETAPAPCGGSAQGFNSDIPRALLEWCSNVTTQEVQRSGMASSSLSHPASKVACARDGVHVLAFTDWLFTTEYKEMVEGDLPMLTVAVLLLFVYLSLHMSSALLGIAGALVLVVACLLSLLTVSAPFRPEQGVVLFLMLGVGADDLLVFFNAYAHELRRGESAPMHALRAAYKHTALTVFGTSFTTFVAFAYVAAFNQSTLCASCGLFGSAVVLYLYLLTLSFWPPAVVLLTTCPRPLWLRHRCCGEPPRVVPGVEGSTSSRTAAVGGGADQPPPPARRTKHRPLGCGVERYAVSLLARALEYHSPRVPRWLVPSLFALVSSVCCAWGIAGLPNVRAEAGSGLTGFPTGHPYESVFPSLYTDFIVASDTARASLYCGIDGIDRHASGFSKFDPRVRRGEIVWDETFDLEHPEAQATMIRLCSLVEASFVTAGGGGHAGGGALPAAEDAQLADDLVVPGSVRCILREYYSAEEQRMAPAPPNVNLSSTSTETAASSPTTTAAAAPLLVQPASVAEIAVWAEQRGPEWATSALGLIDGRARFVRIDFDLRVASSAWMLHPTTVAAADVRIQRALSHFAADANRAHASFAPSSCFVRLSGGEPVGSFAVVSVGEYFLGELRRSLGAGVATMLLVLCALTRNGRLSILAALTAILTILVTFGLCGRFNAELGFPEVIVGLFSTGFAVDFPIHLSHAYAASQEGRRRARALDALSRIGSAVLGSGLTTVSSLVVMSLCRTSIFTRISTLAIRLITTSLLLTLCLFVPALMLVGPQRATTNAGTDTHATEEARMRACLSLLSDDAAANGAADDDTVTRELEAAHVAVR
jgi:hypothetical protein